MARDQQGFSLIELLIVVAIILVIAAIAIPNLMRSRIAANQASAIESCRMINTAEVAYYTSYGIGFSSSLIQLAPPAPGVLTTSSAAGYLDSVLAGGVKSGYLYAYTPTALDPAGHYQHYSVNTNPSQPGISGTLYYFTDYTNVIRDRTGGPASPADSSVAQWSEVRDEWQRGARSSSLRPPRLSTKQSDRQGPPLKQGSSPNGGAHAPASRGAGASST